MQRLADYIGRHGYHWWTSGEIAQDRTQHLVRKFATLYGTDLHRNTRSRRKQSGSGAAILLIYRLPRKVSRTEFNESGKNTVWWTLLVTDGRIPRSTGNHSRMHIPPRGGSRWGNINLFALPVPVKRNLSGHSRCCRLITMNTHNV